ncbi:PREDICTED: facilitated trehalose transporter Tret1-like [Papilio xuthus]|uniref:Facilitated trehalose transporter Tret1-like n=1 Tax=Papilio xuthus TaxID=66420 RepID=A0AAJ6ZZG9_PAPXU|nr:PREDICTED: facilitated trehalose transporter Tret1-like [Papilio xuthus]
MSVLSQIGCSVVVCYMCLSMGLMYAWPSCTLKLFSSNNTTLNRPMTETELALFGSLSSIGALIGTPLSGFLLDAFGRKYSCILFSLPQVISWSIVTVSTNVELILAAMFLSGIGGCALLIVPVYVSEICQESIRGMMTSGAMIFYGIGLLLSYLLGGCLEYNMMNYVCLSMAVVGVLALWPLWETPIHLLKKGMEKDAAKAIAFYRRLKETSKEVNQEINNMKRALNPELDDLTPEEEKLKPEMKTVKKMSKWRFIKKSRSSRRALLVALTLYLLAVFQGLVVVQVYAEPLFAEALPNISPTVSSVLLAVITVVAGCIAAYLIDVVGRRPVMIYASLLAGICCIALGSQIHVQWGPHWVTGVCMYLFCITYTFGAGTVPYVLGAEVFLPEIKSLASMVCSQTAWASNFIILFIFNPLVLAIGLGPVFYFFAVFCFSSAVFCFFCLPETMGLPVDVIQTLFAPKKKIQSVC